MKQLLKTKLNLIFGKQVELRVKIFHVLAITGFFICVVMTGVSIAGQNWMSTLINMGAGAVSLALLIYSIRSGQYRFCYWVSIVVVFFILFPSLFFSGGGYKGGMAFFFVFAVVFTVYMLDGWSMIFAAGLEMIFYSCLCVIAYKHPELITAFPGEQAVVFDIIICFCTVSISLGVTMFVQLRMYGRQQDELEIARKAAESASNAKSAFLANMSHEIRTPIHMILGMNEIIHRESRSTQVKDYSEKIDQTSKMLLSLVDGVLDVSKIESGKMELVLEPYESKELVGTLSLIGKTQCSKKNLQFKTLVSDDLPEMLYGDLPHIRQIASNFLSNAVKYTESGEIEMDVSAEPGNSEKEILLCISVKDTGMGIREEAIPGLFDAFTRADVLTHKAIEGTGLGLTIVKELTALMHGHISVESKIGKGSQFTVKIPQKIIDDPQMNQEDAQLTFLAPEARILIVDDNEGNRVLMRELLSSTKMSLDTAASAEECLRLVQEHTYHLILMDYMMPGKNGLDAIIELQSDPDFHTPIIALTADATSESREKLLSAGAVGCLTKPVPWNRLQEALTAYLPESLVIWEPAERTYTNRLELEALSEQLAPYSIVLDDAMHYFGNDLHELSRTAYLFLRHTEEEERQIASFQNSSDCYALRFAVHTLKGKSKNLGMNLLSGVCAHLEALCQKDEAEEIQSLLPYLFYLWEKGRKGAREIIALYPIEEQSSAEVPETSESSPLALLPQLLQELRRKPSLRCIDQMLAEEQSERGLALLRKLRAAVDAIQFETAEQIFAEYTELMKGEQH